MDLQNKEKNHYNNGPKASVEKKKKKEEHSFWHIDREMFRFKLHFFLLNGALGAAVPYVSVLARNRVGFSATSMAAMTVAQRFLFIFTKTVIGYLADYFKKLKAIICVLIVFQGLFVFLLLTIPKVGDTSIEFLHVFEIALSSGKTNISIPYEDCRDLEDSEKEFVTELLKLNDLKYIMFCDFTSEVIRKSTRDFHSEAMLEYIITNGTKIHEKCHDTFKNLSGDEYIFSFLKQKHFDEQNQTEPIFSASPCTFCNITSNCCSVPCTKVTDEAKFETASKVDFQTFQYWTFALFCTIAFASMNALFTLSDTACCETLQKTCADFGRQRMWSAIGWGLMCPVGGFLNDYTNDYVMSFACASVLSLLSLWNLFKLELVQPHFSKNILKDVGTVFKSTEFLAFEAGVLLHGICMGFVWFNLIWFLTEIGASRFLCGLVQFVQCIIGDIPCMFFSGWLLNKLGHFNVLSLAFVTFFIRFIAYSQIGNPWYIIPFESLHGLTFGVFIPAMANYAKIQAKPGTEATTQAILFATHEGLGAGIGSVLAGMGFDQFGGHQTYLYASILAGCSVVISVLFTLCIQLRRRNFKVTSSTETNSPTVMDSEELFIFTQY